MTRSASQLGGGFADPVFEAQAVFRSVLVAMGRPCSVQEVSVRVAPPPPLTACAGAVLLALADAETPVFLDQPLARADGVASWISFHIGAAIVERPKDAAFGVLSEGAELAALHDFPPGSAEYPDRSATLIVQTPSLLGGQDKILFRGPGIEQTCGLRVAGLPANFAALWSANTGQFPLGVDLIFAAPGAVAALPRSAALVATGRSQACT